MKHAKENIAIAALSMIIVLIVATVLWGWSRTEDLHATILPCNVAQPYHPVHLEAC